MTEEPRIEPYYQNQGKFLTDTLFDLGCLSESLSRDGIAKIEDLAALMFQQIADSVSRCSGFVKKYKKSGGEGERVRHEEELRWIARAKEAEARVVALEKLLVREEQADKAWKWGWEVCDYLKTIAGIPEIAEFLKRAIELGIIPKEAETSASSGAEEEMYPGKITLCDSDMKPIKE